MDLSFETQQLARTNQHICAATCRIAELHTLAEEISAQGGDATDVEKVIETCMVMLEEMINAKLNLERAMSQPQPESESPEEVWTSRAEPPAFTSISARRT